jgi:hypothetical protein
MSTIFYFSISTIGVIKSGLALGIETTPGYISDLRLVPAPHPKSILGPVFCDPEVYNLGDPSQALWNAKRNRSFRNI